MEGRLTPALFLALAFFCASPAMAETVVGHWFFYKKIYQGQEMPEPPDADLKMHFEFGADGTSHLYWWHEGEGDRCSRKGRYAVGGGKIREEVVWVDPANSPHCAADPDMQLGRSTETGYYFRDGDLALRFHLGEEPLDMVWKKIGGK